jgi:hypothetical protein
MLAFPRVQIAVRISNPHPELTPGTALRTVGSGIKFLKNKNPKTFHVEVIE